MKQIFPSYPLPEEHWVSCRKCDVHMVRMNISVLSLGLSWQALQRLLGLHTNSKRIQQCLKQNQGYAEDVFSLSTIGLPTESSVCVQQSLTSKHFDLKDVALNHRFPSIPPCHLSHPTYTHIHTHTYTHTHTHTHTHIHGSNCTHINMLTVCIHPANMLVTHEGRYFLTGVKIQDCGRLLWETRIWFVMNAKHTAEKLLGYLVSGYRLNEFVCACRMCAVHACASTFVRVHGFVLHLSKTGALAKCNTLTWWLVAGGGWSNSLSEANSMLTSQRCHMLVLAHSPVGQSQSKPISQTRSGSVNPPEKSFLTFFFLSSLRGFWMKEVHEEFKGAAH